MQRHRSLLQRIVLVALAAVVSAWLVASLIASRELDKAGELVAAASSRPISAAELADARGGLERARRWGVDDGSLYAEVGLLIVAGRPRGALRTTERLVRLQPERFEVWRSLYGLTAATDPRRANQARRRALELNPGAAEALPRASNSN